MFLICLFGLATFVSNSYAVRSDFTNSGSRNSLVRARIDSGLTGDCEEVNVPFGQGVYRNEMARKLLAELAKTKASEPEERGLVVLSLLCHQDVEKIEQEIDDIKEEMQDFDEYNKPELLDQIRSNHGMMDQMNELCRPLFARIKRGKRYLRNQIRRHVLQTGSVGSVGRKLGKRLCLLNQVIMPE